jgi:hypothetical protein
LVRLTCAALVLFASTGCVTPAVEFARRASAHGMAREFVRGELFDHVVFRRPRQATRRANIYLDGDGTPWLGGLPAHDPTPREPLVLALMARDPTVSIYLGRPCYHGTMGNRTCETRLWTSHRYSETVVTSMAAALRNILDAEGIERVVLIGYSGGGVLAMLLAPRMPETTAVLTVAANLDVAAWGKVRGEPPLAGSLDPARQPPLAPHVYQRHYAGGRDRIVPQAVVRAGARGAPVVVIPEFDHTCCWTEVWTSVLEDLDRLLALRLNRFQPFGSPDQKAKRTPRVTAWLERSR